MSYLPASAAWTTVRYRSWTTTSLAFQRETLNPTIFSVKRNSIFYKVKCPIKVISLNHSFTLEWPNRTCICKAKRIESGKSENENSDSENSGKELENDDNHRRGEKIAPVNYLLCTTDTQACMQTHAHADTNACMHKHACICTCTCMRTNMHTHAHACTCIHACTRIQACNTSMFTHMHAYTCMYKYPTLTSKTQSWWQSTSWNYSICIQWSINFSKMEVLTLQSVNSKNLMYKNLMVTSMNY